MPGHRIHARVALLPQGWCRDVLIDIGHDGRIAGVRREAAAVSSAAHGQVDILLPAPTNLHAHGFQRAMAGLTEHRSTGKSDSFWTWRQLMYRFLEHLTPDHVEAITAFAQMEMLEAGFAASVEFHYLHHQPSGRPYDAVAEMSNRIASAAGSTGIGLTLLPVLYRYGGLDHRPLGPGQRRFGNDANRYLELLTEAESTVAALSSDAICGVAPHSLRAVDAASLSTLLAERRSGPVHIHIAEQRAEVEEVFSATGARPVDWLMSEIGIDQQWCLVHATHMTPEETLAVANSGAVVGLCPLTESNLADGIFNGDGFFQAGGRFGVGSDSHIRVSLSEELRCLEYSQRLSTGHRAVLATPEKSSGRTMFDAVLVGGAQAAGRQCGAIRVGDWADLMSLDGESIHLLGREDDRILDSFIFAGDDAMVRDVWSAGRHMVQAGVHRNRAAIESTYRKTILQLCDLI